eukprot:2520914-Prymnesium_polylepis.2
MALVHVHMALIAGGDRDRLERGREVVGLRAGVLKVRRDDDRRALHRQLERRTTDEALGAREIDEAIVEVRDEAERVSRSACEKRRGVGCGVRAAVADEEAGGSDERRVKGAAEDWGGACGEVAAAMSRGTVSQMNHVGVTRGRMGSHEATRGAARLRRDDEVLAPEHARRHDLAAAHGRAGGDNVEPLHV